MKLSLIISLLFVLSFALKAEEKPTNEVNLSTLSKSKQEELKKEGDDFWRHFSAGFLVNYYPDKIINKAEIRNGVVRVTDSHSLQIGVGLQSYFPWYKTSYVISNDGTNWVKGSEISIGPYAGAVIDSKNIIDNFSIGLAYSHRRTFGGMLIGIGYVFDPQVQRLSNEFVDGKAAPNNATQVSFKNESTKAIQAMVSFTAGW